MLLCFLLSTMASPAMPVQQGSPANVHAGPWQSLGPLPRRLNSKFGSSGGMQTYLSKLHQPTPWPALRASFPGKGKLTLPWLDLNPDPWLALQDALASNPRPRHGLDSGKLDLGQLLPLARADPSLADGATAFLYRTVLAGEDLVIPIALLSPQPVALWCNGQLLLQNQQAGASAPLQADLLLHPGINHLLLEVQHVDEQDWSVEMRERRPVDQERIDRAIDRGVEYLLARQSIDGNWKPYGGGYLQASTSIATYTLLACGVGRRNEAVMKGLAQLRRQKSPRTYSAALQLMALVAGNDSQDRELIIDLSEDLISWQLTNGMWAYGGHGDGPGPGAGDLSNTQYGALGLRAAIAAGVPVPVTVWEKLTQGTLDCREGRSSHRGPVTGKSAGIPNGFGYSSGYPNAYPSMTAAGIGTLAICADNLPQDGSRNLATSAQRAVADGVAWLGANWSLSDLQRNFLGATGGRLWDYYYLYGLERAGVLAGAEMFGEHDWYREGAALLVEQQKDNGGWGLQEDPVTVCFALLFLKRATAQPPVTNLEQEDERLRVSDLAQGPLQLRASLRHPPALWIDRTTDQYDQIAKVIYWLRPPGQGWIRQPVTSGRNFALQPELEQPGSWSLRADAVLIDGSVITSGTIDFEQKDGLTAERRAYLEESERNQLRGASPQTGVSSNGTGASPGMLTDGNLYTSWTCAATDAAPELDLKLRRSARGTTLRLVPRIPNAADPTPAPRPTLVEIRINSGPPQTLRIPVDPHAKAILDLGKEGAVRRIRLRILAVEGATLGEDAEVGFSEIEVL